MDDDQQCLLPGCERIPAKDQRHTTFKDLIFRCYKFLNGCNPPWDGSEASVLSRFLKSLPDLDEQTFAICLYNYARSEIVRGSRPRRFIMRLMEFKHGPLNKFKNEMRYDENQGSSQRRRATRNSELLDRVFGKEAPTRPDNRTFQQGARGGGTPLLEENPRFLPSDSD